MNSMELRDAGRIANDFRSARFWAAEMIENALYPGACAVDATLGNGHDALWLCNLVGEQGHVYGFDVQQAAVDRSAQRLAEANLSGCATLICDGHQNMRSYLREESADAIMFNLGWLPGADHRVTTRTETTLAAVNAALQVLKMGGVMTVCVYPGHAEGARERDALLEWARGIDEKQYDVMLKTYLNQTNHPPLMIAFKRNLQKKK